MLTQDAIDAFNTRLTVNLNTIKNMPTSQLDRVKAHGSTAEALLKNRDFAMFVHQYKFEVLDELCAIKAHTPDDNARRVALSNQLAGVDSFVASLQRAVYMKDRVVTLQTAEPTSKPREETV